jgi:hypothetical protein
MEGCITAVPMLPGEAPMMLVDFRVNELAPQGRDPQSMAFFNAGTGQQVDEAVHVGGRMPAHPKFNTRGVPRAGVAVDSFPASYFL